MLWLLLSLILTVSLAYHRAGLRTALAAYAGLLLAYGVLGTSPGLFGLALLLFCGIAVALSVDALREEWLTRPALDIVQRRLLPSRPGLRERLSRPRSSSVVDESAAAEPSIEQRLIGESGLRERPLQDSPMEDSESAWPAAVHSLAGRLSGPSTGLSAAAHAALRQSGLFGLDIAGAYDGLNLRESERNQVLQALAALPGGGAAAAQLAATASAVAVLQSYATEAQQRSLLPRVGVGDRRISLADRSPWGDDPLRCPDRALVRRGLWKGRETLGIELRFHKVAVPLADDFIISLSLSDPDQLLGAGSPRPTLVLVARETEGLQIEAAAGQPLLPKVELRADRLFLPLDRVLGGAAGAATSMPAAAGLVALARSTAAIASGCAVRMLRRASTQARSQAHERRPERSPATRHRALSDAALDVYGLDLIQRLLCGSAGTPSVELATLASTAALDLYDRCRGALAPLHSPCEPADAIASLGPMLHDPDIEALALASFPRVRATLTSASGSAYGQALAGFDAALWPMLGDVWHHQARALLLALTDGRLAFGPETGTQRHWQRLARYRAAIACAADAWLLGRNRGPVNGATQACLQTALMALLGLVAALYDQARTGPAHDALPLLDLWCARCCKRIEAALDDFIFLQPTLAHAIALRLLTLPLGRQTPMHSDAEAERIVSWMHTPGSIRNRLFAALPHASSSPNTPDLLLDKIDAALDASATAQRRLADAIDSGRIAPGFALDQIGQAYEIGLINAADAEQLRTAHNLCEDLRRLELD